MANTNDNVAVPADAWNQYGNNTTYFDQDGQTLPFTVYGPYKVLHGQRFNRLRDLVTYTINIKFFQGPFHRIGVFTTTPDIRGMDEQFKIVRFVRKFTLVSQ